MADATLTFENLHKVFERYGARLVEIYQYLLSQRGKNASHTLSDSVSYIVRSEGTTISVSLRMEEYWRYVEYGRKPGKMPPPSAILKWIEAKPIIPKPNDAGRIPSPKSLAFLIARKIGREGIKPTPILQATVEDVTAEFRNEIQAALQADIGNAVRSVFIRRG